MKLIVKVLLLGCILSSGANAQNIHHFFLYSYDHALFNPAAAGAEKKHVIGLNGRFTYDEQRWEDKMVPYTGMISYNGNIAPINSGIGFFAVVDRFGAATTSKVGVSYNYKIKFAPKSSLRIGIRPTLTRHAIDYRKYRYVDPLDPTNYDQKVVKSAPDLDLGLWMEVFGFYLGGALNNTFKHQYKDNVFLGELSYGDYYSSRSITIIAGKKIKVPGFQVDPSIALFNQKDFSSLTFSNNFTFGNFFVLGGSYIKSLDSDYYDVSLNSGISIVDRVQLIGIVYTRNNHRPGNYDYKFFEGLIRVKI